MYRLGVMVFLAFKTFHGELAYLAISRTCSSFLDRGVGGVLHSHAGGTADDVTEAAVQPSSFWLGHEEASRCSDHVLTFHRLGPFFPEYIFVHC
jgi:hypothetical protein